MITYASRTVPFAAVISPGSLSVALNETQEIKLDQVPQPLFNKSASFTDFAQTRAVQGVAISGFVAKTELWQVALSAAVSGQIAAISLPYRNVTYRYQFNGPAIRCETVGNVTEFRIMYENEFQGDLNSTNYTSWINGSDIGQDQPTTTGNGIYVATGNGEDYNSAPATSSNTNITECRLYDSFYDVLFQFRYPEQTMTLLNLTYEQPFDFPGGIVDKDTDWTAVTYAGIMDTFGRLLVGTVSNPTPGAVGNSLAPQQTLHTSAYILHINWQETETTRVGLEQLFQNITLSLLSRSDFM